MVGKKNSAKSEKSLTKAQMASEIATKTGMSKSQVTSVLEAMTDVISDELKHSRPVTIPGLVKIKIVRKAATAARPGRNPATGEEITIKAKPAKQVVKVRALKSLKDMA